MKKFLFTWLSILCAVFFSYGQQLEVLAPAGEEVQNASHQVSFTMGELVVETAQTETHVLTQGYHQSKLVIIGLDEISKEFAFHVYPNPTSEYVILESEQLDQVQSVWMYDIKGSLIQSIQNHQSQQLTVNMQHLSAGTYVLKIRTANESQSFSYQIIKTH